MNEDRNETAAARRGRKAGAVVQGLVLGLLVSLAVVQLVVQADDVRIFRYQTF